MTIPEGIIYYTGRFKRILYAKTKTGKIPAREYFDSIGPLDWGKLDKILKRLADHGRVINKDGTVKSPKSNLVIPRSLRRGISTF